MANKTGAFAIARTAASACVCVLLECTAALAYPDLDWKMYDSGSGAGDTTYPVTKDIAVHVLLHWDFDNRCTVSSCFERLFSSRLVTCHRIIHPRSRLRGFASRMLADEPVGKMVVLAGNLYQFPAPLLVRLRSGGLAHLVGSGAVVLRAGEVVLHRL